MNKQSQCINALRFPLAVAVVAIHATVISVQAEGMEVFNTIFHLVSDGVAKIAVPLFFAISAWLFFVKGWTWQGYAVSLVRQPWGQRKALPLLSCLSPFFVGS